MSRDRADIDDRAARFRQHRQQRLGQRDRANHIDLELPPQRLRGNRFERPLDDDPSHVHETRKAGGAGNARDLASRGLNSRRLVKIEPHRFHPSRSVCDARPCRIPRRSDDVAPLRRQPLDKGLADPRCRASDQMRAVLERYLAEMSASIEADCQSLKERSLDETAAGLVDAFIAAKWRRLEVSRAMHEPLSEVGGVELVRAAAVKGAAIAAKALRGCREISRDDVEPLAVFLVMACTSMLQAAFMDYAVDKETLRAHIHAMARGYLREMRAPGNGERPLEGPTLSTA